jgi:arylsulfatase A-like enzyme
MLSRRHLLTAGGALTGLSVLDARTGQAQVQAQTGRRAAERPNLLWFISDDASPFIGAYGDTLARTPTIDRLARQGLLYENFFSTAPVCAPSRFTLITGMRPESCGPAHHMRADARLPTFARAVPQVLRDAGYFCSNNSKTDYNAEQIEKGKVWDESSPKAHWRGRPEGAPFYAVFTTMTTHEMSLLNGQVTEGAVQPAQVRVPAYLPDTPAVRRDFASYYNRMERMDQELASRLIELEEDGLAEDTIVFYFSDNGGVLPRSKRFLYDAGTRCPLIVRCPERWRHLLAPARASRVSKPVGFIDLPPTLLDLAGVPVPPHMQGRSILARATSASLPVLAAAPAAPAAAPPYAFCFRNRMDECTDMMRSVSDGRFLYIRNYMPHRPWGLRNEFPWMLKSYQSWETEHLAGRLNKTQAVFWGEKPFEEFFDLQADTDQVQNLVDSSGQVPPALQARIGHMREALDAHMLHINDNGFIPEGAPQEGWGPSRDAGSYPLRDVMAVAATAARRDAHALPGLRQSSQSPHAIVRHWAAQGLLMLGPRARNAVDDLDRLAVDALPHTRVVASEALVLLNRDARALDLLAACVERSALAPLRLQALEALLAVGTLALPVLERIRLAVLASSDDYVVRAGVLLVLKLRGQYRPGVATSRGAGLKLIQAA